MTGVAFGQVPFAEQIAFFLQKLNVNTESYLDVWAEQHDRSFMVAGANRDALVQDLREAVANAIENGASLEDFRRDFDRIVTEHGWDYNGGRNWRSRVIYETNLRMSFAAGRWKQLQALKQDRPYWQYVHNDSVQHPRPLHLAWNGLVLHADDPWWHTHFPPNGWGCRCEIRSLSRRDLAKLGKDGPDTAPPIDMQTVTVGQRSPGGPQSVQTPKGIDPGFGYAPGRSLDVPTDLGVLRAPPGVPPIPAPIADGLNAAFDATDARYLGLPEAQAHALHAVEREIADALVEHAIAIDAAGITRLAVVGIEDKVDLRPYLHVLRDLVLTHNHPSASGFSPDDIATAAYGGVAEIRVITAQGLYRLSPPDGQRWPFDLIDMAIPGSDLRADIAALALAYVHQALRRWPHLTRAQQDRLAYDRLMLLLMRRYGLIYRVVQP